MVKSGADDAFQSSVPSARSRRESLIKLLPFLIFLFSISVTYRVWDNTEQVAQSEMEAKFKTRSLLILARLEQRMLAYEGVLWGLNGLFAASDSVNRNEFRTYVQMLRLQQAFPGIQGVGYAQRLSPAELDAHLAHVRSEGFRDYRIRPEEKRGIYTSIVYLEPFSGRNLRAFGYDMYTDSIRRQAMMQAMDTGQASISGKVRLVQEDGQDEQAGFLMYLPVYRNGMPHDDVEKRRKNLTGWVYAPFRMNDLMAGLNENNLEDIDLEIYDGAGRDAGGLMFDLDHPLIEVSPTPLFQDSKEVVIAGHPWFVVMRSRPGFEAREKDDLPSVLAWAGTAFSVFLALLTWLLVRDRARAIGYADRMHYLSNYDQLTGLPNRALFADRFQVALASAKRNHTRLSLFFMDLDKFKPINDAYGHAVGDQLLREVSKRLKECIRESDTAARIGGDEFVVLLTACPPDGDAMRVCEKIISRLKEPFSLGGQQMQISASIGVAFYPEHGQNLDDLTRSADTAMYAVKKHGSGNIGIAKA